MDPESFDDRSDCSSEASETRSELESRIYSIIHHNDFSGTTEVTPSVDPKYGVEFDDANGEVVVYLRDPSDIAAAADDAVAPSEVCGGKSVIPTTFLNLEDAEDGAVVVVDAEFAVTSLKKKKKKKKKNKSLTVESIEEYIKTVKTTNVLEEYKTKSGLNKMQPAVSSVGKFALNVAVRHERALPMTSSEVLKQYSIGKTNENSLWYRCPDTWTPDMVKYYTQIKKSKRNFDCKEELEKIKEKYGSSPIDWVLSPMDMYKSHSNTPRIRCHMCKQFGHTSYNCREQFKPEICIMCGLEGHNYHNCNKKLCLSCGTWQKKFTNNCYNCISMSRIQCSICSTVGHESSYCTESWRQFHSTISTETAPGRNEFAQSASRSTSQTGHSTKRQSVGSTPSPHNNISKMSPNKSLKSDGSGKSKKAKRLKRLQEKKRHSKSSNSCNSSVSQNDSVNISVNVQDVVLNRTLTKKNFFKQKR